MESAHVVAPAPDLEAVPPGPGRPDGEALRVLFPHRLEEDKDPMSFARAVRAATRRGARIEVVLTGGDPERARGEALDALALLEPHLVSAGMRERGDYLELIGTCDVVASTARHEFFGIAVAEAMAAGCAPLLPDRLNYPALVEGLPAAERARRSSPVRTISLASSCVVPERRSPTVIRRAVRSVETPSCTSTRRTASRPWIDSWTGPEGRRDGRRPAGPCPTDPPPGSAAKRVAGQALGAGCRNMPGV